MSIVPRRSLQKGMIEFDIVCGKCGESHRVAVKPGSIALDVKLLGRKNRVLDAIQSHPTFRPPPVA